MFQTQEKRSKKNVVSSAPLMKLISMNSVYATLLSEQCSSHATLFMNELISMNNVTCYTIPVGAVPAESAPVQSSKCIEPGLT